ncbi:MAG: type II toxin-antitoxin system VapC family toxin [Brevundimonas sp.]
MLVVDASFVAAAFAEETHTDFARDILDDHSDQLLLSPALIRWELASVFWKKLRKAEIGEDVLPDLAAYLDALRLEHPDSPDGPELGALVLTARAAGLSAYDAAYFALALEQAAPLATVDKNLTRAAIAAGLPVRSPFT